MEHSTEEARAIFVTDYTRGKMLPADDAYYVKMVVEPRTGAVDYAAFRSARNAVGVRPGARVARLSSGSRY